MKNNAPLFPEEWQSKIASDCFQQISTTKKKVKTKDCNESGLYPVIDQGQASVAGYIDDPSKVIEVDIPLCIFGDHTRVIKWVDQNFVPGADGTKVLQPSSFLFPRFAYQQLRALEIPDKGYSRHFKFFKEMWFGIPPFAEQKVIAQKLDALLAQVESTKASLQNTRETLKRFRLSVLAAAVSGKLTEEWRSENPYDVNDYLKALAQVRIEKHEEGQERSARKSKYKSAELPFDYDYDLYPKMWGIKSLSYVTHRVTYGLTVRPKYVEEGVPIISAKEIKDGVVDYIGAKKFDRNEFGNQRDKCKIFKDDILFSKTGSIGHVAHVDKDMPMCSSQNIAVLSPLIGAKYLELVLRSNYIQDLATSNVKANAIPDLQLGVLSRFPIPVPSVEEQTEIVRRVERLFAHADTIEKQTEAALARVSNLTQSILAKAFRGELTEQWREDNPELISGENSAEALLEKFKAERAAAKPKRKTRKKA